MRNEWCPVSRVTEVAIRGEAHSEVTIGKRMLALRSLGWQQNRRQPLNCSEFQWSYWRNFELLASMETTFSFFLSLFIFGCWLLGENFCCPPLCSIIPFPDFFRHRLFKDEGKFRIRGGIISSQMECCIYVGPITVPPNASDHCYCWVNVDFDILSVLTQHLSDDDFFNIQFNLIHCI